MTLTLRTVAPALALLASAAALAGALFVTRGDGLRLPDLGAVEEVEDTVHLPFGPVRPARPLPDVDLALADGSTTTLAALTEGRWTLLQLMFTSCSTTCPIQGAIFQRAESLLGEEPSVRFLSVSIDPITDEPGALRRWLDTYGAGASWTAGSPRPDQVNPLVGALHGIGEGVDVHDARVYLIDPEGRLAFSTEDLPDAEVVVRLARSALADPNP